MISCQKCLIRYLLSLGIIILKFRLKKISKIKIDPFVHQLYWIEINKMFVTKFHQKISKICLHLPCVVFNTYTNVNMRDNKFKIKLISTLWPRELLPLLQVKFDQSFLALLASAASAASWRGAK